MPLPSINQRGKKGGAIVTAPYPLDYPSPHHKDEDVRLKEGMNIRINMEGHPVLVSEPQKPQGLDRLVNGYEGNPNNKYTPARQTISPDVGGVVIRSSKRANAQSVEPPTSSVPMLPDIRMTPNFHYHAQDSFVRRTSSKTPTEGDLKPVLAARHLSELRMTQQKREQASQRAQNLNSENASIRTELLNLEKQHKMAGAVARDSDFTGDGTSLDTYVKELAFYKRFGGPASQRTQYMKFAGGVSQKAQ